MIKCKTAIENPTECGKDLCCFDCPDLKTCKNPCSMLETLKSSDNCPNMILEGNEVVAFESKTASVIQAIKGITLQKKALEEQEKQMRTELETAMEQYNVKSFENEFIKITYVAPTTKTTLDSKKLKELHPDIFEKYSKTSDVKASIKITVK